MTTASYLPTQHFNRSSSYLPCTLLFFKGLCVIMASLSVICDNPALRQLKLRTSTCPGNSFSEDQCSSWIHPHSTLAQSCDLGVEAVYTFVEDCANISSSWLFIKLLK